MKAKADCLSLVRYCFAACTTTKFLHLFSPDSTLCSHSVCLLAEAYIGYPEMPFSISTEAQNLQNERTRNLRSVIPSEHARVLTSYAQPAATCIYSMHAEDWSWKQRARIGRTDTQNPEHSSGHSRQHRWVSLPSTCRLDCSR